MSLLCWRKRPAACFPGCKLLLGADADPSFFSCCSSLWAEGSCPASQKVWEEEEHSVFREMPFSAFLKASLSHLLDLLLDFNEKLIFFWEWTLNICPCVPLPVGSGFPAELPSWNHDPMLQEDLFWCPSLPGISGDSRSGRSWPVV